MSPVQQSGAASHQHHRGNEDLSVEMKRTFERRRCTGAGCAGAPSASWLTLFDRVTSTNYFLYCRKQVSVQCVHFNPVLFDLFSSNLIVNINDFMTVPLC